MYYFGKFKYWCQKVLPLVYDDSLSYYEVLCKLMKHISDMLDELDKMGKDITNLQALYVELKNYVDHYFESADFTELIDARLDQMVEDGTFDEIINQELFGELDDKINGITATSTIHFVGGNKIGNCAFIKDGNKAVVIDTGSDGGVALLSALISAGITKIDAIIVSHWHNDHSSGVVPLINNTNNIDTAEAILYCPHENMNWASMIGSTATYQDRESTAKLAIEAVGGTYIYPYENQEVVWGDGVIKFNNLLASYFAEYYNVKEQENDTDGTDTAYNNFSMVVTYTIGGKKAVFPADIMPTAQVNMATVCNEADLYVIEHHGLNYTTDVNFLNGLKANLYVLASYGGGYERAVKVKHPTINKGFTQGAVYETMNNSLIFEIGNGAVVPVSGNPSGVNPYINVLSVGYCIAPESDHDDDFNNYTEAGIYVIPSAEYFSRMDNRPSGLNGGGKLLVSVGTELGAITQYYLASSSTIAPICVRCMDYDGVWHRWNTIFGGTYRLGAVDNDWWVADVTPTTTQGACRLDTLNCVATLDLRFTTNEEITAENDIMLIPSQMTYARTIYFLMFDADGVVYPCRLWPSTDGIHVYCMMDIADQTELYGSVTWTLNPANGYEG